MEVAPRPVWLILYRTNNMGGGEAGVVVTSSRPIGSFTPRHPAGCGSPMAPWGHLPVRDEAPEARDPRDLVGERFRQLYDSARCVQASRRGGGDARTVVIPSNHMPLDHRQTKDFITFLVPLDRFYNRKIFRKCLIARFLSEKPPCFVGGYRMG